MDLFSPQFSSTSGWFCSVMRSIYQIWTNMVSYYFIFCFCYVNLKDYINNKVVLENIYMQ